MSSSIINLDSFRVIAVQILKTFNDKLRQGSDQKIFVTYPNELENYIIKLFKSENWITFKPLARIINAETPYTVIAISNTDPENLEKIASVFQKCQRLRKALLVIPKFTDHSKIILEKYGLQIVSEKPDAFTPQVCVGEFPADFVPIEPDFFLMPSTNAFKNTFLLHDTRDLYNSARALSKIQYIYGRIPQVVTVGECSERIHRLMLGMLDKVELGPAVAPSISALLIIDRLSDLITPLLIAQPCEQLINEYLSLKYGIIKIGDPPKFIQLDDNDQYFKEYRYKDLNEANIYINNVKAQIENSLHDPEKKDTKFWNEKINNANDFTLNRQIRDELLAKIDLNVFLKNCEFFYHMSVSNDLFSQFKPLVHIERLISLYGDWHAALRLLIVYSMTQSKPGNYLASIQREILAEFGPKALEGLMNLEYLKLVGSEPFGWEYDKIREKLGLMDTDWLYCYKPLSISLASKLADNNIKEVSDLFPGSKPNIKMNISGEQPKLESTDQRRILVFFTGGVSLGEVAFLKKLSHEKYNDLVQFIIGATDPITGNELIEEICPFLL